MGGMREKNIICTLFLEACIYLKKGLSLLVPAASAAQGKPTSLYSLRK